MAKMLVAGHTYILGEPQLVYYVKKAETAAY